MVEPAASGTELRPERSPPEQPRSGHAPVSRGEALAVLAVSVVAGVAAALCDVSPTGSARTDAVVTFAMACLVTWLAASAPWWTITAAAVIAVVGVGLGPWVALALIAMVLGIAIGWLPDGCPWPRSVAAGCVVVALLHVSINPFLGASAIVAGVGMSIMAIVGLALRNEDARRRVLWSALGVIVLGMAAAAGLGIAVSHASSKLRSGGDLLQGGLDQLRAGNTSGAAQTLRLAAADLDEAGSVLDAVWTQPAKILPVVAQHRALTTRIVTEASASAIAAADALSAVDVDQLRFVSGSLDIDALGKLAAPLGQLDAAVRGLAAALDGSETPWLIDPVRDRLAEARDKIDRALVQTAASASVAANGPAVLGADGARHYLVVFTAPGMARGLSGAITDYAEISITDGSIKQTTFGRVGDLVTQLSAAGPVRLDETVEYFERYGPFGAGTATTAVDPGYWADVTMSPDMPTASKTMAQMYAAATHRPIDGVIVIDPVGLAGLVQAAGPITIPDNGALTGSLAGLLIGHEVSAEALQQFLLVGQYTLADDVRAEVDEAVAGAALQHFLSAKLPGVQDLADALGTAATEGHITWWATRSAEEETFRLVGMAGRLPAPAEAVGSDGLAVVTNDAGANMLDAYLQRSVTYAASYDSTSGHVTGDATITLRNGVPSSALPAGVIANALGLPTGTNRMLLSVYSPLTASDVAVDGVPAQPTEQTELGWNVTTIQIDIAPGATATVTVHLDGVVASGGYSLLWRPQPLTTPDDLRLDVLDGSTAGISFAGQITRTSRIVAGGISAVR